MGGSDHFANMNEVYVRIKITRKEQPAIRLQYINGGPNSCRCQSRLRFAEAEGKSNAKWWQYNEDQFKAMRDQIEDLTTRISNMCSHKGNGSRNLFVERRTHGRQHHAQAHANRPVSKFELHILEFQGDPQPEEFLDWVLAIEEVFEFNGVPDE
jgi:hypothetical protein